MPLVDAKLDPVTHDVVFVGGDIVVISGPEEIAQAIRIALKFFLGEWFLDRTAGWLAVNGMPLGKIRSMNAVRARALQVIQGVEGVAADPPAQITDIRLNPSTRKLSIDWVAYVGKTRLADTTEVLTP